MFEFDEGEETKPRVIVVGVGGAGGLIVEHMIGYSLQGCEFAVINTDLQALKRSPAPIKIQLGKNATKGLGARANPETAKTAALENIKEIDDLFAGSDLIFMVAGMGGGTGTGSSPVIAEAARKSGALVVGIITLPFAREGRQRKEKAESGVYELRRHLDCLIAIPNDQISKVRSQSILDAFKPMDALAADTVRAVYELFAVKGMICIDFADIRAILAESGMTAVGIGEAIGLERAIEATNSAIASCLTDKADLSAARGALINIRGSSDMTMDEFDAVCKIMHTCVHEDANIVIGVVTDEQMEDRLKVTAIFAGLPKREGDVVPQLKFAGARIPERARSFADEDDRYDIEPDDCA